VREKPARPIRIPGVRLYGGAIKYLIPNMEIIFLMNSSSMEYRLQVVRMSIIT